MIYKIFELNSDINTWYRSSKLPKFIRKQISRYKRNRLRKLISKYTNDKYIYASHDIYEFFVYVYNVISDKFMYINDLSTAKTHYEDTIYFATLSYKDSDQGLYHFIFSNVSVNSFQISIRFEANSKIRTLFKTNCNEMGLLNLTDNKYKEHITTIAKGLNCMIGEMISKILNDELDRSERIYDI